MSLPTAGTYRFDGANSLVKVFTYKVPNLMSKVAHDLELRTHDLTGEVTIDGDEARVEARIGLWNLEVRKDILSRLEKSECERIMRKKVIGGKESKAVVTFVGNATPKGDDVELVGDLSIIGSRPRKVTLTCSVTDTDDSGFGATLRAKLLQTDYGITPYKAMMGMLKIQDAIEVEIDAKLRRA